jgi:hypothetical protein
MTDVVDDTPAAPPHPYSLDTPADVLVFQEAFGLDPDGIAGPNTRKAWNQMVADAEAGHPVEPLTQGFDAAQSVLIGGALRKFTASHGGKGFVIRYLSYNPGKNWTEQEADAVKAALGPNSRFSVWEANGDEPEAFTEENGVKHATEALKLAAEIGQAEGSGLYFAVDFDAERDTMEGVQVYFHAIEQTVAGKFKIGAYADGLALTELKAAGLISLRWLACAGGWGGSAGFTDWDIKQSLPADPWDFGWQVDPDVCRDLAAAGGW